MTKRIVITGATHRSAISHPPSSSDATNNNHLTAHLLGAAHLQPSRAEPSRRTKFHHQGPPVSWTL